MKICTACKNSSDVSKCASCHDLSNFHLPNSPLGSAKTSSHYQVGQKQPIEIMQEVMTKEEFVGFLRGNVIKYSLRFGHKDEALKEAGKIEQYSKWLCQALGGKKINPME